MVINKELRGYRLDLHFVLADKKQKHLAKLFVEKQGLRFEDNTDVTLLLFGRKDIIGTASFKGKIIKGVAISEDYRGKGLGKKLLHRIIEFQRKKNIFHSLIFTSPYASGSFQSMGFSEICRAEPWVVMLEYGFFSFDSFVKAIIKDVKLIEKNILNTAFVVHECFNKNQVDILKGFSNRSPLFLFLSRNIFNSPYVDSFINSVNVKDVAIINGEDYFFPFSQFPTYYIKNLNEAYKAWVSLDCKLFCKLSVVLGIKHRILWAEQIDYNKIATPILTQAEIEVSRS
jgi:[citrate (pro-3S)-lyase] ligase